MIYDLLIVFSTHCAFGNGRIDHVMIYLLDKTNL